MRIYTKTGDQGTTSLASGKRVSKADLRLEAYGTADELNSFIGLLRAQLPDEHEPIINYIQNRLFNLGALLADAPGEWITEEDVHTLEEAIDHLQSQLTPLKAFVLPAGNQPIALCHVCRTITRRLERQMVALPSEPDPIPAVTLQWINRLSDFLFVLALFRTKIDQIDPILWKK